MKFLFTENKQYLKLTIVLLAIYFTFNLPINKYIINPYVINIGNYIQNLNQIIIIIFLTIGIFIYFLLNFIFEFKKNKVVREHKTLYVACFIFIAIYLDIRLFKEYEFLLIPYTKFAFSDLAVFPILTIINKGIYQSIIDTLYKNKKRNDIIEETSDIELKNDKLEFKEILEKFKTIFKNDYTKSFKIGINGKWGSGKSTLIKFILEDIKKDNTINYIDFHFNPFESISEKSIETRFFEELSNSIARFDKNSSIKIELYSNTILKEEKWHYNLMKIIIPKVHIKNIEKTLLKSNKKLIIIIDDLDRLTDKNEIINVLKIIRNFENIQNTYFIISYWKEHLIDFILKTNDDSEIIETDRNIKKNPKDTILDKFINYEYSIPEIDKKFYLKGYLSESLLNILKDIHPNIKKETIEMEVNCLVEFKSKNDKYELLDEGFDVTIEHKLEDFEIYKQFENLRDLKRFLILYSIDYKTYKNHVNFFDYFIYSIWKFKNQDYTKIYYSITDNPMDIFTKHLTGIYGDRDEIDIINKKFQDIKYINYEESKPYLYLLFTNRNDNYLKSIRNPRNYQFYFQDRAYPTQINKKKYEDIKNGIKIFNELNHLQRLYFIELMNDEINLNNSITYEWDTIINVSDIIIYVLEEINSNEKEETQINNIISSISGKIDLKKLDLNNSYIKGKLRFLEKIASSQSKKYMSEITIEYTKQINNYLNFKNNLAFVNLDCIVESQKKAWLLTLLEKDPQLLHQIIEFDIDENLGYDYFKIQGSEHGIYKELETCIKIHFPNESKIINWDFVNNHGGFQINLYKNFTSNDIAYMDKYINIWKPFQHHTLYQNGKYADKKLFQKLYFISSINEKYTLEDARQGRKYYLNFSLDIPIENNKIEYAKIEYQVDDFLTLSVNETEVIKRDNAYYKKSEYFIMNKNLIEGENSFKMIIENVSEVEGSFSIQKPEDNLYGIIFNLEIKFDKTKLFGGSNKVVEI